MGDRNACVGRGRCGRGNTGDDFEGDSRFRETLSFLTPPAEDEWIPPLEADDDQTFVRQIDEQVIDVALVHRVMACGFSGKDQPAAGLAEVEHLRGYKAIVHDGACLAEKACSAKREKLRVAWPSPDNGDTADW